jgi:hypothetical protein
MAIGIFAVGATGVVSMQQVTSASNRHAKNIAVATAIAQSWQEQLAADATRWTQASGSIGNTTWLVTATDATNEALWHLPAAVANFGPAFGPTGEFVDAGTAPEDVVFCTHIRMTTLLPDTGPTAGAGLLRSEVRVFWPKPGERWDDGAAYCASTAAVSGAGSIGEAIENFHFVYKTTALRQTPLLSTQ